MSKDYYKVLGISKEASQDEIKKAFRHLARKYHPDVNPGNKDAESKFKEISEAFEVLKDPEKRSQYDQFGTADFGSNQGYKSFDDIFSGFGFDDIFSVFSGGRKSKSKQGADLKYDLEITLEQAYEGLTTKIEVPRNEKCSSCNGNRSEKGSEPKKCEGCNGTGEVRVVQRSPFGQMVNIHMCNRCKGVGKIIDNPCKKCRGSGLEKKTRIVEVKIPEGVDDGSYLRLSGQGEAGSNGGQTGDLYIVIHVKPHEIFERNDENLFLKTTINFYQAVVGDDVEIPTIKGKAKLKIPAGTQSHTVFRLSGQGMPKLHNRGKGDLFAKIVVDIPKKISKNQKDLLYKLSKDLKSEAKISKGFFERLKEFR